MSMILRCIFVCSLLFTAVLADFSVDPSHDVWDYQKLVNILSKPRVLERHKKAAELDRDRQLRHAVLSQTDAKDERLKFVDANAPVLQFSWSNCGPQSDPIKIRRLAISPDPISLPGSLTVTADVEVDQDIGNATSVQLHIHLKRKIFIWIPIPCIDKYGSCTYDNICSLDPYNSKACPAVFTRNKLPCKCPIPKATYNLRSVTFPIKLPHSIPSWIKDGDYRVKAILTSGGKQLICFQSEFSIST